MLLNAVDELITDHGIGTATRTSLKAFFSKKQVLDIISLQGLYVTIACIIGTWPVEIEEHIVQRLPEEVTEESFKELLLATDRH
jgi:hypothetical protein